MKNRLYPSLIVLVILFLAVWTTHAVGKGTKPAKHSWEYKAVLLLNDPGFVTKGMLKGDSPELNQLGAEGWELVTVLRDRRGGGYLAYLKRQR